MPKSAPEATSLPPEILAKYEPVIGLEVHVQLLTRTKIFCGCSTRFGDPPNTNVCPVCLGLPGTLPVLNKRAVEMAMRASLALNCTVHEHSRFARKNYFYPDLPKGYQISQYELPLATGGWLEVEVGGAKKRIGITRLHLEEDAAKNLHEGFLQSGTKAYIDYNRCGTPLSEIVSEPDMRTPEEAYAYLTTLRQIMLYTGVSDCNMEEGSLRCDANVSVRPRGAKEFGTKVEVKNLNSFRFLQKALEYEIERHIGVLESGGRISQETRLWNQAEGHTVSMRSKEKAHDYRYFPEPDLLPVHVSSAWREEVRARTPNLPDWWRTHFVSDYGLTPSDADVLTSTPLLAEYFETVVKSTSGVPAKTVSNWIQTELLHSLNDRGITPKDLLDFRVSPPHFGSLIEMIKGGQITAAMGKKVFARMFDTGTGPREIVAAEGLMQIFDLSEIEQAAREVIAKNPDNIAKFKSGNEGVFKFFVGQVMKATRGQANPQAVNDILRKLLS
jgi:aspartyl-tRNA(Asn)/glutamyl-tRNA(Gln) amidotransferase subunit B